MSLIEHGLLSNGNETSSSQLSTVSLPFNEINCEYIFFLILTWLSTYLHCFDKALPTNYVRLPSLSNFNIAFNMIEGPLPMFQNVAQLILRANEFTGSIPTEYGLLRNLTQLRFELNHGITGTVPTELMECDKMSLLSLHNTGISGNLTFCDSLGENLVVEVPDLSMCGEECKCCCETFMLGT